MSAGAGLGAANFDERCCVTHPCVDQSSGAQSGPSLERRISCAWLYFSSCCCPFKISIVVDDMLTRQIATLTLFESRQCEILDFFRNSRRTPPPRVPPGAATLNPLSIRR
jgi:hypothetical protein